MRARVFLIRLIIGLAAPLALLSFAFMAATVTHLLWPSMHRGSWVVPVATETSFTVLYLLGILCEIEQRPIPSLRAAPWPFAAVSVALNIAAGRPSAGAMAGHGAVTATFYLLVIAGEAAIRRLSTSDHDYARAEVDTDIRACAADLLTAAYGRRWRRRAPQLLVRQLRAGRFPAPVAAAAEAAARYPGSNWQATVAEWITGPPQQQHIRPAGRPADWKAIAAAQDILDAHPGMSLSQVGTQVGRNGTTVGRWIRKGLIRPPGMQVLTGT